MPIGGFIIADNVLWSGKVVEEVNDKDQETKTLKEFNTLIHTSGEPPLCKCPSIVTLDSYSSNTSIKSSVIL